MGLEPTRIAPRDPKSRSSASSDTPPLLHHYTMNRLVVQPQWPRSAARGKTLRHQSPCDTTMARPPALGALAAALVTGIATIARTAFFAEAAPRARETRSRTTRHGDPGRQGLVPRALASAGIYRVLTYWKKFPKMRPWLPSSTSWPLMAMAWASTPRSANHPAPKSTD